MAFYIKVLFSLNAVVWISAFSYVIYNTWHSKGAQRAHVLHRLKVDWMLFKRHFLGILGSLFLILYVQGVIARDLAYYRHRTIGDYTSNSSYVTQKTLKDIGFEVVGDYSESLLPEILSNLLQYSYNLMLMFMGLAPYIQALHRPAELYEADAAHGWKPEDPLAEGIERKDMTYTMFLAVRMIYAMATGHAMRMLTFLSTSLPGAAPHCTDYESEAANRPKTFNDIFFRPHVAGNCGDLIFSGHMLFAITAVLVLYLYAPKLVHSFRASNPHPGETAANTDGAQDGTTSAAASNINKVVMFTPRERLYFALAMVVVLVIQMWTLLASRSHYTVDMVVGIMIAYFNFEMHNLKWRPQEPNTDLEGEGEDQDNKPEEAADSLAENSAPTVVTGSGTPRTSPPPYNGKKDEEMPEFKKDPEPSTSPSVQGLSTQGNDSLDRTQSEESGERSTEHAAVEQTHEP